MKLAERCSSEKEGQAVEFRALAHYGSDGDNVHKIHKVRINGRYSMSLCDLLRCGRAGSGNSVRHYPCGFASFPSLGITTWAK